MTYTITIWHIIATLSTLLALNLIILELPAIPIRIPKAFQGWLVPHETPQPHCRGFDGSPCATCKTNM